MRKLLIIPSALISITILSFLSLTSNLTSAESSTTSNVSVSVPVSCNITNTKDTPHTATINPGTYKEDIGTTTFKVFCNDNAGYSIYAIGYSNEEYGNTNLIPTNISNPNIITGTATTGNTSNWSMKLNPLPGTYTPTIENDFSNYRTVPDIYTKVATLTSNTDFTIGSTLQSTYKAYIQSNQPADTYTGKVKYTLVHPNDANPPEDPRFAAQLDTGSAINVKMKNLANGATTDITTIARADTLPSDFIATDANTISLATSPNPVYIFFDDTTGTMYYYSESNSVILNSDSSFMFYGISNLVNINALSSWNVSNVTDMSWMFGQTKISNLDALSSWNVSNVTNMSATFYSLFSLTDINGISNWDVSSVTDMSTMFYQIQLTNLDALAGWDTSNVVNMYYMFGEEGGGSSPLSDISGLSDWDTSSVTDISSMFDYVDNIDGTVLDNWDISKVTNMQRAFSGSGVQLPSWCDRTCQ